MTNPINCRHLFAGAAAVPLLPAAAAQAVPAANAYGPDLDTPGINWPAVRERIAYAGDVLEIPPAEVRAVLAARCGAERPSADRLRRRASSELPRYCGR